MDPYLAGESAEIGVPRSMSRSLTVECFYLRSPLGASKWHSSAHEACYKMKATLYGTAAQASREKLNSSVAWCI